MAVDRRVTRRYEVYDEDQRLWAPGLGELVRLRTWDIFGRYLPPPGRILDVGGGPGTHAARLAGQGWDVTLVDPVPGHLDAATARAADGPGFSACLGQADELPAADGSVDAVLLMGPLYHLFDRDDRLAALAEARRVLRPGGRLLAEVITRHAWLLDATVKQVPDQPGLWESFERTIATGMTQDPGDTRDGAFWAYFHRTDELGDELAEAGFGEIALVAVEGVAWLLGDLEARMAEPARLLEVVRLTERAPELLGCSAHVMGVAAPA
jgi:SAM-dependent methyltransferase